MSRTKYTRLSEPRILPLKRRGFTPSALVLALSSALALPGTALAVNWTGAVSNDWFNPGNWVGGTPAAGGDASINTSATNPTVVNAAGAATQTLEVGATAGATGLLTVSGGGTLDSVFTQIGQFGGSNGTATVTGAGSTWANGGSLQVGASGTGALNISSGGTVTSNSSLLGFNIGSTGAATVDGAGSTWTNNVSLMVGDSGNGSLDIANGGVVTNNGAAGTVTTTAGNGVNSVGTITVNGAGSSLANNGGLVLGSSGTGGLLVINGGTASNAGAVLGNNASGVGQAFVTGAGSTWASIGDVVVGNSGAGQLIIQNGGAVSNVSATIGANAGSTGGALVDGVGSKWTNSDDLFVGLNGSGALVVSGGGQVDSARIGFVGYSTGSTGSVAVDGAGSILSATLGLDVGRSGTGTLDITSAGTVNSGNVAVGGNSTGMGTVSVNGNGSTLNIAGDFTAGNNGQGTLNITGGGAVSNVIGIIGAAAGSSGGVTVTGAGSTWTNSANLIVGHFGTGNLAITNGGVVNSTFGSIASQANSSGFVTIDGSGSKWVNSVGSLTVGSDGAGRMDILNGGVASSVVGTIGGNPGASGAVKVDGAGSTWTNSGTLAVGANGDGTLQISNGGAVSSTSGVVAYTSRQSWVTVDGPGSTWTNSANLIVGHFGTGNLAITNGGVVNSTFGSIASQANSSGFVTIDGSGSKWVNSVGSLTVGSDGAGRMDILNGGVASSVVGTIGGNPGASGAVKVDGAGSTWTNSGALAVGANGDGTLQISNGGAVSSTSGVVAYTSRQSWVTVDGPGSTWTNTTDLTIGHFGDGSLGIANGGLVTNASGLIANNAGSNGAVTVTGAGSTWTNTADIFVGNAGTGSLLVANGGTVSSLEGVLGAMAGSSGTVTVDGAGSAWNNTFNFSIGDDGTGTLAVLNGGTVNNGAGYVARNAGSTGTVAVDGAGSALNNSGDLHIGVSGAGMLAVSNGGAVANQTGMVAVNAGSTGAARVDGAGSLWATSQNLFVGEGGTGSLTLSNGGVASVAGVAVIADLAGSTGTINIGGAAGQAAAAPGTLAAPAGVLFGDGVGTLNFNHTDNSANYAFDAPMTGLGAINQNAGWTRLTADSSGFTGLTHVNGGRLAVNGSLANSLVDVNSGGTLGGSGFVGGIQAKAGGMVAPGNSIGTLNVTGNVSQAAGSVYEVELSAAGQSDLIKAGGAATIQGGALLKPLRLGAAPLVVGAHYTVLQADGGISGMYSLVSNAFMEFAATYDATHAYLDVTKVKTFAQVGLTPNQKAAGEGTERLGSGNLVYEAVLLSPTESAAQAAFDQLSGEVHASARGVQLQDSHFARDASLERLRALDSEVIANDGGADEEGKARLLPSARDLAYWARAMGSWGRTDGDGNAAGVKRDTSGFLMGADTRFGEEGRFGLMGGYSRSAFDATDRNSSGSSENYHFGAYAGSRFGDLALRTGISYSWHDVSTSRAINFPGFTDSLKAGYKANTTQAFAELGYRIKTEQAEYEPFVNLANVNVSSDGFTERGGAAALSSAGNSSGVTFSTVGLRASTSFDMNGSKVMARGSLGWRNASGDVSPTTALAFAGGSPFAVAGAPVAKSAAVVEAGLDFKLTNAATLGLSYGGQFGSGLKDHSARIQLNVAF